MASDAYISTFDRSGAGSSKTQHINSAGAISAAMEYAIYDRKNKVIQGIFPDSTSAETHIVSVLLRRDSYDGRYSVITVPK